MRKICHGLIIEVMSYLIAGTTVTITQADIDTKTQSMRDSLSSVNFLPSVSIGLVYRY